jgi:hypothetical protein
MIKPGIFKINLHTQELQCLRYVTSSTTFQLNMRELNLDFGMQQIQNNFPQLYRYVTALTSLLEALIFVTNTFEKRSIPNEN